MCRFCWLILVCLTVVAVGQKSSSRQPISQREACAQFSDAIVSIDAGGHSLGSGFVVSPDGYIMRANHVVRNGEGVYYSTIAVTLSNGDIEFATTPLPISPEMAGQDVALLKITPKKQLSYLNLGSVQDVVMGPTRQ